MKPRKQHGKTTEQWEAMCLSKRRFSDEPAARAAAQIALSNPSADTKHLFVYKCPNCRGWHLTHKNYGGQVAAITKENPYKDDRVPKVWKFFSLNH